MSEQPFYTVSVLGHAFATNADIIYTPRRTSTADDAADMTQHEIHYDNQRHFLLTAPLYKLSRVVTLHRTIHVPGASEPVTSI